MIDVLYLHPGSSPSSSTGAIAGGVAAGAALLFAAPAIVYAWYRRRHPQDPFYDVPGEVTAPLLKDTELKHTVCSRGMCSITLQFFILNRR